MYLILEQQKMHRCHVTLTPILCLNDWLFPWLCKVSFFSGCYLDDIGEVIHPMCNENIFRYETYEGESKCNETYYNIVKRGWISDENQHIFSNLVIVPFKPIPL